MDKRTKLITVNSLLLLAIFVQIVTSIWMYFFSPPGWLVDFHRLNGAIFLFLLLVHLVMNFAWFKKNNPANLKKKKTSNS